MINQNNYFTEVKHIDYNKLPEGLKEGYDTIKFGSKNYSTWDYLNDDPEFLDLYFSMLNKFVESDTVKPKNKAVQKPEKTHHYAGLEVEIRPKSPRSKLFIVWDAKKDQIFANEYFKSIDEAKRFIKDNEMKLVRVIENKKTKTKTSVKAKSKAKAKPEPNRVELMPLEISFIRRFTLLNGKVVTKRRLLTLLSSLQKAMLEKRVRKTSVYAKDLMYIQNQLIKVIEKMDEQVEISIAAKTLEKYKNITSSQRIRESIALLKRYLSLHGKTDVEEKAERLKTSMERMVKRGKVTKTDPYAEKLEVIYKALQDYLLKKKKAPQINKGELNGVHKLVGNHVASSSEKPLKMGETVNSQDLLGMTFETIGLQGKFRELIGDPSVGFTAMVFGQPKSGKSTLMLEFAHELASKHGKVLYSAIEEGYGYTLKEKIQRLQVAHPKLVFSEQLPTQLAQYDFVFIDSVSRAGMELEDLIKLKNRYPKTGFIFIFHSTKEGKFRGGNAYAHEVDVIIEVEPSVAKASGRFGVGGEVRW